MLLLGIIIGLGAGIGIGYGIRSASQTADANATADDKAPPAAAETAGAKPYSEQTVTPSQQKPPTEPPPIPADAPAPPAPSSAPPAPVAPPIDTGRLIVRSVPANAGVMVDGTWRGRTPLTVDKLRLGSHEVRIVQTDYAVARQSVDLTAKAPARTLSFRLERAGAPVAPSTSAKAPASASPVASRSTRPAPLPPVAPEPRTESRGPGSLYVDSRPRGAAVFLDGRQVGVTPATIPDVASGPHVVRIELLDHRPWTAKSQVLSGQQTRVTGSLERIR